MILLLAMPVLLFVGALHRALLRYAPSNVLIRRAQASRPAWRGVVVLTCAAAVALVALEALTFVIESGAPDWLYVAAMIWAWDTIKFSMGVVVVATSTAVRTARHTARNRRDRTSVVSQEH